MSTDNRHADARFVADRRSFMIGLGAASAAATCAPFAALADGGPAVAAAAPAAPVGAVFWGLPYTDFTGTAAAFVQPRPAHPDAPAGADPHAELLGLA